MRRAHARRHAPGRRQPGLVIGAAIVVAYLTGCGGALPMAPAATVAPFPGHGAAPLLIDALSLQHALRDPHPQILVLDYSSLRTYRRGHVPGALHAWWQDTMNLDYPAAYGTVLPPTDNQQLRIDLLHDLGIGDQTFVIAYDDDRGRWAARMVWFLRFLGHDRAAALDGGLAAWRGAGGKIEDGALDPPPVDPPTVQPRQGYYVWTETVADRLHDPATVVVDTRTEAEARDDLNGTLPLGRIPGAVSLPWTATLRDEAGRLKSPAELATLFRQAGVTPDRHVIVYGRFGVEAAQPWFVLKLLGYPDVAVYDRGWAEWATTPGLPVAPL